MSTSPSITHKEQQLVPWIVLGNPKGLPLVFLSGFPDNCLSSWSPVIDLLKEEFMIIALCLPGYNTLETEKSWVYFKLIIYHYN